MFHFLLTTNLRKDRVFQAEMLVRSLLVLSGLKDFEVTLVITGKGGGPASVLEEGPAPSDFLKKHVETLYSPSHFSTHPPVRWFVKPRRPVCVFLDTDIVACGPVECPAPGQFAGVLAHESPCSVHQWRYLFGRLGTPFPKELFRSNYYRQAMPYYVNFGVLFVPSALVPELGVALEKMIPLANSLCHGVLRSSYYASQVALSAALYRLKVMPVDLPLRWNYPDTPVYDYRSPGELKSVVFYHYLGLKGILRSVTFARSFASVNKAVANHHWPERVIRKVLEPRLL